MLGLSDNPGKFSISQNCRFFLKDKSYTAKHPDFHISANLDAQFKEFFICANRIFILQKRREWRRKPIIGTGGYG
jgi:hypothetical protein